MEIGGELKRLFSVREAKKGLLIIKTDADGSVSVNDGVISEVLTCKHTVHTSDKSATNANLVHMTQEYENGTKKETFSLTHAVRDDTFVPIYQRVVPDLRERPTLFPHHKDVLVNLGSFDPGVCSLIFGIWLSSAKAATNFPASEAYATATHEFGRFSLSVAYGFTPSPSTVKGVFLHYATSSEGRLTEEERRLGYRTGITNGAAPNDLPHYIVHELNAVIDLFHNAPFEAEKMVQKRVAVLTPPAFFPTPPQDNSARDSARRFIPVVLP